MNWEQMFQAMQALLVFKGDAALHMREPGNWYMSLPSVEIKHKSTLEGVGHSGPTPEAAVRNTWTAVTNLEPDTYLVINAYRVNRRAVKWNGFMWEDITEEDK